MATQVLQSARESNGLTRTAKNFALPAGILLSLCAACAFLIGIATPPRSGPFCTGSCIAYPYTGAAQFFPRDYYWMFAALPITPLFAVIVTCLHFVVPRKARPLSLLAVLFAGLSTALVTLDYFLQIFAVQPSLAAGEAEGVALLTQYNPHGVFIVLEDLGYLMLTFAMLFAGLAVPRSISPGMGLRWLLSTAAGLSLMAFAGFAWALGTGMGLGFEIGIITIQWPALMAAGILFALFFRHADQSAARAALTE